MAADWLRRKGYEILETNWRHAHCEMDIIARQGRVLIFTEVKTRSSETGPFPEMAIDHKKQKSMIRSASAYLTKTGHDGPIRFDIISIIMEPHARKLTHFKDAFFPMGAP